MKKIYLIIAMLCATTAGAVAQNSMPYSSYFLDGVSQNHKLNASLMPERGYFSLIPVLSGFNMTMGASNLGLGTFLYPSATNSNELNTFLHPDVSNSEFLKNVSDFHSVDFQFDMTLLSFGFFGFGGFNTFDLSFKSSGSVAVAGDLFKFMKMGQSSTVTNYDLSGTSIAMNAYAEAAIGHSHKINEHLTIGVKAKYLAAGAGANISMEKFGISLSDDVWNVNSQIGGNIALAGATFDFSDDAEEMMSFDTSALGLAGRGFAVDLGATYRFFDWLEASASVNDLGFIDWEGGNTSITSSESEFIYSGFEDLDLNDLSIDDQIDDLVSQAEGLIQFDSESNAPKYRERLTTDINVGAEFLIPGQKDRYSAGLLYTMHILHNQVEHRGMVALNLKFSWINLSGTYSLSSYGSNVGGMICLCPNGLNLYLGADYGVPTTTSSFIPVEAKFGLNLNMGLNFSFGKRNPYKSYAGKF